MLSIIIPVFNEETSINDAIRHIHAVCSPRTYEVLVIDGSPAKNTLSSITDKSVIRLHSDKGRAVQMNTGAEHARGNILVFLHADTKLPPDALHMINETLHNNDYVAGAFGLHIDTANTWLMLISAITTVRSRLTKIPYGDQAIFIKKDYFHAIGMFKNILIMEDVELMKRIKKRKDKIKILNDRVVTSSRRWQKNGFLKATIMNRFLRTLYACGVNTDVLHKLYYKN